ncbi:MAG: bacillithiol biosynthesis deacetylase BshB2 [Candidatus Pristimantibacillus sp.]
MEREHILVILPHPDDEAFGISGTLARSIDNGAQVTYACLTLGEMGRNMGVPIIANRVTLPEIRKKELQESCLAIGIQDVRMMGFHDKTIEFEDQDLLDGVILDLIEELRPTLIITFYPGYSVHPDHDATGAAVVRTVGKLPADERPPVHCLAFSKDCVEKLGEPDIGNDVTSYLDRKLASVSAHRSQFPNMTFDDSKLDDEELRKRFGMERFWTYSFS